MASTAACSRIHPPTRPDRKRHWQRQIHQGTSGQRKIEQLGIRDTGFSIQSDEPQDSIVVVEAVHESLHDSHAKSKGKPKTLSRAMAWLPQVGARPRSFRISTDQLAIG